MNVSAQGHQQAGGPLPIVDEKNLLLKSPHADYPDMHSYGVFHTYFGFI